MRTTSHSHPSGVLGVGRHLIAAILLAVLAGSTQPGRAQSAGSADDQFVTAYTYFDEARYHQAVEAFGQFRERYSTDLRVPKALYYEGRSLQALGNGSEAVNRYQQLVARYPSHPLVSKTLLVLGQYHYEQEQYDQAIRMLDRLLAQNPSTEVTAQALYWMGETYLSENETVEAREYFRKAANTANSSEVASRALHAIGYTYAEAGDYENAAQTFEQLATQYPESPYARNTRLALGEAYYEIGNYQQAVSELKEALPSLDGNAQDRATFLLAESYNQLRDSENAILYYRRFTKENTDSPYFRHALYGLAWNYYFEGVYEWAAERFRKVREDHRDMLAHRAMYYEAVNMKLNGQTEEALKRFEGVVLLWPEGPLSDHAQYEKGIALYQMRRWTEAMQAFRKLVEQYPESSKRGDAYRMLAEAHVALGEFTRALQAYDEAIALDAASQSLREQVRFQKAWLLYRANRYKEAAKAFVSLYESDPAQSIAGNSLFWAAESYYQTGNYTRANQLFNQFINEFPTNSKVVAAHYALGWTNFKAQRYQTAANHFRQFLDNYTQTSDIVPYDTDARLRLADSYFAMKQYEQARQLYRQVEGEGIDYAIFQMGKAFYYADQPQRAIEEFRRLIEDFPYSQWREEAQYLIGHIHSLNNDYKQAIDAFQTLLQRYPDHSLAARAQYGIGDAYYNMGQYAQATDAYKQVMENHADSPFLVDALSGIQYSFVAQNKTDSLQAVVDSFAVQHPDSPHLDDIRFRQGQVLYQSGQLDKAIRSFQQFVRTAQSDEHLPEAYLYIGRAYAEQNQTKEAISYLQQLVNQYPESESSVEAAVRLGELYREDGQHRAALEIYRKLVAMDPASPDIVTQARYGEGISLLNLGQINQAQKVFKSAVESATDSTQALTAQLGLARVLEQQGRYESALTQYRAISEQASGEVGAEALYRRGALLLRQGNPKDAVEVLNRLPVLYPGYPDWLAQGLLAQARAQRQLGNTGQANQLYQRVQDKYGFTEYAQIAAREQQQL